MHREAGPESLPVADVAWRPSWRLVASRFPPRGLFDRVASQADLDIVVAIEGLTNDRLRTEAGDLALVPEDERVFGPGTTPIMAAFTHLNPDGSRFSDGSYGVYYAAASIDTAVAETRFHKERFLRATQEPPVEVDMRSYASDLTGRLHDLRGLQATHPEIYHPDPECYAPAQALARTLRAAGAGGLVYDSVRDPGGACAAVFRPALLSPVRQGAHYCFVWNGAEIEGVYVKTQYTRGQRV